MAETAVMPLECLHCGHYLPHIGEGILGPNLVVCVGPFDDRHMPAILLKDDAFDAGYAEAATNRPMCDVIHRSKR